MPKAIIQHSLDGSPIREWESAAHAEVALKISSSNILKVCKGKRQEAGGYKWTYADTPIILQEITAHPFEQVRSFNNDNGTFSSSVVVDHEPKNDLELAALHRVNLEKYKISQYWSKLRPDGKFTSSILASLIKPSDISPIDVLKILNNYKSSYVPISRVEKLSDVDPSKVCLFIDITDFHLDKRDLEEKTPEGKKLLYIKTLTNTLKRCYNSYNIDKIAFILGSDMLHTDNILGQTTKGTPQEYTLRWNESFEMAFDIYCESIQLMKQFCNNLDIILVCGNHARTKEFYLAFALEKYFDKDKSIKFDCSPEPRKLYTYGNTFIGLHHGNTRVTDLPLVFSKQFNKEWGNCKFHEIKIGDKHHYMEKDYSGVLIKQLPALTGDDSWHNDHNYVNQVKASICSVYDFEKGRVADIHERP